MSTQRQGASGLGIEAQARAVEGYVSQVGQPIIATFIEVESGAQRDRPELARALALCRKQRATLLIARLDRLSRSLSFVAQLLDADVDIRAADMPEANRMMLQMLAVFAEHERRLIGERTKAALAAAKGRGVKLGKNGSVLAASHKAEAVARAKGYRQHIDSGREAGCSTNSALADWLNERGITYLGGRWHPTTVRRVLLRLG